MFSCRFLGELLPAEPPADFSPGPGHAVADVVGCSRAAALQGSHADFTHIFRMNQIDVLVRETHPPALDPVARIPARSINAGHPQNHRTTLVAKEFFTLHARFAEINWRAFIDPRRRILMTAADVVSRRAAEHHHPSE